MIIQAQHLFHLGAHSAAVGGGVFAALNIVGDVRCEFEHMLSLLDAALDDADAAVAIDCPARLRAFNLGRVLRDVLATNSERLGEVETCLRAQHRAAARRQREPLLPLFG